MSQAPLAGLIGALDRIHQRQPVLTRGEVGETPHCAGGVFCDRLVMVPRALANTCQQRKVSHGQKGLDRGGLLAEVPDDFAELHAPSLLHER